ncbi:MAG: peptidoglycan DD-metalloendopeptidase family protein [Caldilineales bacterium]|nr:peptidoglycan DD-metalloendopeptidase family protein [Caldilineales bacterium]
MPYFINKTRFVDAEGLSQQELQQVLESIPSNLADYDVEVQGETYTAARILGNASLGIGYSVDPKVLLALLELSTGLVTDINAQSIQYDGAFGLPVEMADGLGEQLRWLSDGLGEAYLGYVTTLPSDGVASAASLAVHDVLTSLSNMSPTGIKAQMSMETEFIRVYVDLFGVDPRLALEIDQDEVTPFMRKPFAQQYQLTPLHGAVNSFFDHEYPTYGNQDHIRLFTGDDPFGMLTDCTRGVSCYGGHDGLDYNTRTEAIQATASGTIAAVCREGVPGCPEDYHGDGLGNLVAIRHSGGYETIYGHLGSIGNDPRNPPHSWQPDQPIQAGEEVGISGCSGSGCSGTAYHLHFGVLRNGIEVDPFGWWGNDDDPWSNDDRGEASHWLWEATTLTDDRDPAFENFGNVDRRTAEWHDLNAGYQGHAWWTTTTRGQKESWGVWALRIPQRGRYSVQVYIPDPPDGKQWTAAAHYTVMQHDESGALVPVSATLNQQDRHNNWVTLVRDDTQDRWFEFRSDMTVLVMLTDVSAEAGDVVFDAARLTPFAIDNGLQYLRTHQRSDGSWGESAGSTGITALVALAFLNYGFDEHDATDTDVDGTPDIQEAIRYLLSQRRADGSFGESGGLFTYDSALVILVLAAADHTNDPRRYTDQIRQAKDYLLRAQSTEATGYAPDNPNYGGWGYPRENWSDLSNTQWAVMALDAAYSYLGLEKPPADDASAWTGRVLSYADKVQRADGGFDYRQGYFNRSLGSMSHAGIWTNLLAGRNPDTNLQLQNALNWVQTGANWSVSQNPGRGSAALYYYYVTLAKSLAMARKTNLTIGGVNHDWFQELLTELTTGGHQPHADGYWQNSNGEEWESDRHLVTAYAILALETRTLAPNIPLSMSIILHSPADLHLYDAQGRHTGKNYQTGAIDVQIPGSSFVATEPQTIVVDRPVAGNYTVHFVGRDDGGNYEVDILGQQGDAIVSSERLSGVIEANEVQGSFLNVAAIEGTLTIFASEPEVLPVMAVDPASLAFWNRDWVTVERSFTVRETGGQRGIRNLTLFASDLIGSRGHRLPAATAQVTPAQFDLAAGGSRTVTLRIAIPRGQPVDLYVGRITMESISAGAKAIDIELQVLALSFLPAANNTYVRPANWHSTVGLTNRTVFDLASANNACGTVFAGTDQGIYRSWDTGRSWYLLPVGLDAPFGSDLGFDDPAIPTDNLVPAVVTCPANPSVVYMTRWGEGVYRSTDAGTTWQLRSGGALDRYVYDLAASSFSCDVVFAASGEKGVFETNDGGAYWQARNNGLSNLYTRSLAVAAGNADRLVLGTTSGAYYTMDGGVNWWGGGGLPTETIRALAVAHVDANVVYAGTATRGIYRSADGGATWQSTNNGLGNVEARALAIDPFNPQVIYAGRDDGGGVYRSVDGGANWSAFDEDLGSRNIKSLWLDGGSCHTLLAGTTNGVWYFGP